MKLIAFIFMAFMIPSFSGWLTDFDKAKKEAAEKHRYILLNFSGSDWCVPCIKLKREVFETEAFKAFADSSLVLLNADFPRSNKKKLSKEQLANNELLADQYNPTGKFPFTILLKEDGSVVKEWDGTPNIKATELVTQIKKVCNACK